MEKLRKEIEEWKEWLIKDLQEIIKTEIEKDVEVLFDCLLEKRLLKERSILPAVVSMGGVDGRALSSWLKRIIFIIPILTQFFPCDISLLVGYRIEVMGDRGKLRIAKKRKFLILQISVLYSIKMIRLLENIIVS